MNASAHRPTCSIIGTMSSPELQPRNRTDMSYTSVPVLFASSSNCCCHNRPISEGCCTLDVHIVVEKVVPSQRHGISAALRPTPQIAQPCYTLNFNAKVRRGNRGTREDVALATDKR